MKLDDHLNATIATVGLTIAVLVLLSSVAYSAITGKSFDVVSSTLAGSAMTALAGIARGKQPPSPPTPPAASPPTA